MFIIAIIVLIIALVLIPIYFQRASDKSHSPRQNRESSKNIIPANVKRDFDPNDNDAIGKALLNLYKRNSNCDEFNGFVLFYLYLYMLNHNLNSELRKEVLDSAIYDWDCYLAKRLHTLRNISFGLVRSRRLLISSITS